jgi:hypothetical protein
LPKPPAIREGEDTLEIDQKKGKWPYVRFVRLEDGSVGVIIDANEGGVVVGQGVGTGVIVLSAKKARRVREFLERTEL